MIDYLINLLGESPLLFFIVTVNIILIGYIVISIVLYVFKKKQPDKILSSFFWKFKTKRKKEAQTIEDVYLLVMDSLRRGKVINDKDGLGMNARKKALRVKNQNKREILENLFFLYEAKKYGERRVTNEKKVASDLLFSYLNL